MKHLQQSASPSLTICWVVQIDFAFDLKGAQVSFINQTKNSLQLSNYIVPFHHIALLKVRRYLQNH